MLISQNSTTSRRQLLRLSAGTLLGLGAAGLSLPVLAAEPFINPEGGFGAEGYDAVAYFTEEKAVKGDKAYQHEWKGAIWLFSSAENRDTFAKKPEAYAPQYGGYCAYAVSQGYTATIDPKAWTVHKGKLYLNYSKSVRALWAIRRSHHIRQANENWPKVLG